MSSERAGCLWAMGCLSLWSIGCAGTLERPAEQMAVPSMQEAFEPWSVGGIHPMLPGAVDLRQTAESQVPVETTSNSPYAHGIGLASAFLAFQVYKATWSRADGSTCRFVPSCSRFGWRAVRRHGAWGAVLTMGRLTRLHRESHLHPVDDEGIFLIDPVDNYDFWYRVPKEAELGMPEDPYFWYRHVQWFSVGE